MADIAVDAAISVATARSLNAVVTNGASNVYIFFADADNDLKYMKSTDGGQTYGAAVTIFTGTVTAFGIWFDKWTPGDSGGLIYCAYIESVTHDVLFKTINTASADAQGTQRTIFAGASVLAGQGVFVSIAKMRGGNLYAAFDIDAGTEKGLRRSTDAGVTWTARDTGTPIEASTDIAMLFPGNETDTQDCWILYLDADVNELSLKMHDDSAATTSESATKITLAETASDGGMQFPFAGAIRHSDGHLIVALSNAYNTTTADLMVYDMNGTGSLVAKTNITTDVQGVGYPSVYIDQSTDDIYVIYEGSRAGGSSLGSGGSTGVFYVVSGDGGGSWSPSGTGNNAYSFTTTGSKRHTFTPLSGDRFICAWMDWVTGIISNYDNSLDLTPSGPEPAHYLAPDGSTLTATKTALTGDFERFARVRLADYSVAATSQYLAYQGHPTDSNGNFSWAIYDDKKMLIFLSANGTEWANGGSAYIATAGASVVDDKWVWWKVSRRSSDGRIQFFYSTQQVETPEDVTSWTQMGTDITGVTGALHNSSALLHNQMSHAGGKMAHYQQNSDLSGTVHAEMDPSGTTDPWTLVASTGETWTVDTPGANTRFVGAAGLNWYALLASPASIAVTAIAATLARGLPMTASPAAYAITPAAATVVAGRAINAASATFNITALAATLAAGKMFTASPASFVVTGFAATLARGLLLDAQPAAFTWTGFAADLVVPIAGNFILGADPATFAITPVDAGLLKTSVYALDAQPLAMTMTAFAATLAAGRAFDAQPAAYIITPAPAELAHGLPAAYFINAEPAHYAVSVNDVTLVHISVLLKPEIWEPDPNWSAEDAVAFNRRFGTRLRPFTPKAVRGALSSSGYGQRRKRMKFPGSG